MNRQSWTARNYRLLATYDSSLSYDLLVLLYMYHSQVDPFMTRNNISPAWMESADDNQHQQPLRRHAKVVSTVMLYLLLHGVM